MDQVTEDYTVAFFPNDDNAKDVRKLTCSTLNTFPMWWKSSPIRRKSPTEI